MLHLSHFKQGSSPCLWTITATYYKIKLQLWLQHSTFLDRYYCKNFFSHYYEQLILKHMTETETVIYYNRYVDATSGIIAKILNSPFVLSSLLVQHTSECCKCLRMNCLMEICLLSSQSCNCHPENLSVAS